MDIVRTIRLLLSEESAKIVKRASAPPTHIATVSRVGSDGTAWVRIDGGSGETPATCAVACKAGDRVTVVIERNRARVTGNVTAPPTDDTKAYDVLKEAVTKAHEFADAAQAAAELTANAAMEVASAIGQHFWFDDSGAHVSTEEDEPEGEQNTLWNSMGMLFRKAANILLAIVTGDNPGVAIYDGTGNAATNILAQFTGALAQIGRSNSSHVNIDYHSLQLIDKEGNTYAHLSDLRDASGKATVTETFEGDGSTYAFSVAFSVASVVEVTLNDVATTTYSRSSQRFSFSPTPSSGTVISITYVTTSTLIKAYTFGTRAANTLLGAYSAVVGRLCEASGAYSFAEGENTVARGKHSHAMNNNTIANDDDQTVIGRFNKALKKYAFIIGNGRKVSARSNAFTVDWSGNTDIAGAITVKDNAIDRDSSPSSDIYSDGHALKLLDKDGELMGMVRIVKRATGVAGIQLIAYNETDGGSSIAHYNAFQVGVGKDGTRSYGMSDPAKFRSAIGLAETNTSRVNSTNVSSGDVRVVYNATTVTVIVDCVKLSSALSNNSSVTIGTIGITNHSPAGRCFAPCCVDGAHPSGVYLRVASTSIDIVNRSGSQLAAGSHAWCASLTYVI